MESRSECTATECVLLLYMHRLSPGPLFPFFHPSQPPVPGTSGWLCAFLLRQVSPFYIDDIHSILTLTLDQATLTIKHLFAKTVWYAT